eukprot:Pgem_evm1s13936
MGKTKIFIKEPKTLFKLEDDRKAFLDMGIINSNNWNVNVNDHDNDDHDDNNDNNNNDNDDNDDNENDMLI